MELPRRRLSSAPASRRTLLPPTSAPSPSIAIWWRRIITSVHSGWSRTSPPKRKRNSPPMRCGAATNRKSGSSSVRRNCTQVIFWRRKKVSAPSLYLSTNNAEALNGLGLARAERGRAREAVQFFAAAIQFHPDFAPAILNLAMVAQQDLHDNKLALQNYHAYLALTPRPANWNTVNDIANSLEQQMIGTAVVSPPVTQSQPVTTPPSANEPKAQPIVRPLTTATKPSPVYPHAIAPALPPQVVKVQPEPTIVSSPNKPGEMSVPAPVANQAAGSPASEQKYIETGVTPLPPSTFTSPVTAPAAAPAIETKPVAIIQPAARYFRVISTSHPGSRWRAIAWRLRVRLPRRRHSNRLRAGRTRCRHTIRRRPLIRAGLRRNIIMACWRIGCGISAPRCWPMKQRWPSGRIRWMRVIISRSPLKRRDM